MGFRNAIRWANVYIWNMSQEFYFLSIFMAMMIMGLVFVFLDSPLSEKIAVALLMATPILNLLLQIWYGVLVMTGYSPEWKDVFKDIHKSERE